MYKSKHAICFFIFLDKNKIQMKCEKNCEITDPFTA
jgi:hypothetical protein